MAKEQLAGWSVTAVLVVAVRWAVPLSSVPLEDSILWLLRGGGCSCESRRQLAPGSGRVALTLQKCYYFFFLNAPLSPRKKFKFDAF